MSTLDLNNKMVLDFGTGTGVLAILAEKMGAAGIKAIDNDEWSIENLKENIEANDCSKIDVQMADTIPVNDHFDIVLANINLNVILANLSAIAGVSKKGTIVLLSGFLKADEAILSTALTENDFSAIGTIQKGEWLCMQTKKN